jgi:lactoylglutathione lyase
LKKQEIHLPFRINHIHIKSPDPRKAAEWWVEAFGFKIVSDETRPFGDRFVRCQADGGMLLSISNARTGETLAPAGSDGARWGLEHFAIESDSIEADIARLQKLGANLQEGPLKAPNGVRFAFLGVPGNVRIELVELPKSAGV